MNKNLLLILLLGLLFISCTEKRTSKTPLAIKSVDTLSTIPNKIINKSELYYNSKKSIWTLNNELYSGYAVCFFEDSTLKEKFGILNGKKENKAIQWYSDGHYRNISNYKKGKLYGEKKMWSPDSSHVLLSHLNYVAGKVHGEQKKWYPTGELFKKLHLNMGKEEGLQQAFRKNGVLFANYEAKKGRVFGLKKAVLCFGLEDEKIQYEDE